MRDLSSLSDALWSILLTSGYLTTVPDEEEEVLDFGAKLRIPNKEVRFVYRRLIVSWLRESAAQHVLPPALKALTAGDVAEFARHLATLASNSLSYFDIGGSHPERVYHALVMGMLAYLSDAYRIRSNREKRGPRKVSERSEELCGVKSGAGRPDLVLAPNDPKRCGIVMEFKVVDSDGELEQAADKALQQIKDKNYHADLVARGVKEVIALGLAFKGKAACVQHERLS
ncbi:MAG: PD-(D/E)XK nuclease domain-containing protein [Myxococcota bacterium]